MLQDGEIKKLLIRLDRNIEATMKEMASSGVVMECADCAVSNEGTCCGRRTGYKCDITLLLINLLLGKALPEHEQDVHLCRFLTKHGCSLRVRPVICVNFVCQRLRKKIPHEKLIRLQEIAGEELDILFVLEECIKKKISSLAPLQK